MCRQMWPKHTQSSAAQRATSLTRPCRLVALRKAPLMCDFKHESVRDLRNAGCISPLCVTRGNTAFGPACKLAQPLPSQTFAEMSTIEAPTVCACCASAQCCLSICSTWLATVPAWDASSACFGPVCDLGILFRAASLQGHCSTQKRCLATIREHARVIDYRKL